MGNCERAVEATMIVRLDNGEEWEAKADDFEKFGYANIADARDQPALAAQTYQFRGTERIASGSPGLPPDMLTRAVEAHETGDHGFVSDEAVALADSALEAWTGTSNPLLTRYLLETAAGHIAANAMRFGVELVQSTESETASQVCATLEAAAQSVASMTRGHHPSRTSITRASPTDSDQEAT